MHANSPLKRQEWLKECWRKEKKNCRAAQKGKVRVIENPDTPKKSEVIEKPDTPRKSEVIENPDIPKRSSPN